MNFPINDNGIQIDLVKDAVVRDDKVLGLLSKTVNGQTLFTKPSLKKSVHLFRKDNSYGTNEALLDALPDDAIIKLVVDGTPLFTTRALYMKHGIRREFGDYGKQLFLALWHFKGSL